MRNRVIVSKNSVLTDITTSVIDYNNQSNYVVDIDENDAIYIGQYFAFNHLYFKLGALNSESISINVQTWDGSNWNDVVDILDETNGLQASGHITWTPNKIKAWGRDDTVGSNGNERVTGLGDVTIYDRYWVKVTVSAAVTNTTALGWIGQLFCNDNDLEAEIPDFGSSNYKTAYKTGKTDWEEQCVTGSNKVVDALKSANIIQGEGQILDRYMFKDAAVHRTAAIIFSAFGDDYEDQRKLAMSDFHAAMKTGYLNIDKNDNAILDDHETRTRQNYLIR